MNILSDIAKSYGMKIDVIGSFPTGLWFPYCDIDLIMVPYFEKESTIMMDNALEKTFLRLRGKKIDYHIAELVFNRSHNFPAIKL